jgi:hypothetical protein
MAVGGRIALVDHVRERFERVGGLAPQRHEPLVGAVDGDQERNEGRDRPGLVEGEEAQGDSDARFARRRRQTVARDLCEDGHRRASGGEGKDGARQSVVDGPVDDHQRPERQEVSRQLDGAGRPSGELERVAARYSREGERARVEENLPPARAA